ncbi:MAG: DUF5067 domain-containing protein [Propionibacteriaceae bacterium]|nr:DUF5067 domain-containing protein [Propionibacteriaceae bacterium]
MTTKAITALTTLALTCLLALSGCSIPGLGAGSKKPIMDVTMDRAFVTGSGAYDDSALLVINLTVKNNTDHLMSGFTVSSDAVATLGDKTLNRGYLGEDNPNSLPRDSDISAGDQGAAQLVYEIPSLDAEGIVELVITVANLNYTNTVEILREIIDLADAEREVSISEFKVEVTNTTGLEDSGKYILVIDLEFTNNSSSTTSYSRATRTKLFQNGTELQWGFVPWDSSLHDSALEANGHADIQPGTTIKIREVYTLLDNTNDVEIKITDMASYDNAVILSGTIVLTP